MVTAWHATSLETEKTSLSPDCSLTESSSAIVSSGLCAMRAVQKAGAGKRVRALPMKAKDARCLPFKVQ